MFVDNEQYPCGGVFLDNHTIFTAAHCLFRNECSQIYPDVLQTKCTLNQVRVHPGHELCGRDPQGSPFDIAEMKTEEPMAQAETLQVEMHMREWEKFEFFVSVAVRRGKPLDTLWGFTRGRVSPCENCRPNKHKCLCYYMTYLKVALFRSLSRFGLPFTTRSWSVCSHASSKILSLIAGPGRRSTLTSESSWIGS